MVEITEGNIVRESSTSNAMGGTELIAHAMHSELDKDLLKNFQIVHSRVRSLRQDLKRVFVAHDLPGDPESNFLANGGYNKFERLVFVSNWQMQKYIDYYGIPWYKCVVIKNAIEPIPMVRVRQKDEPVRLIYHTTPHRGLDILAVAWEAIAKEYGSSIHLDVYSSFKIYGWEERDEPYKKLFEFFDQHPNATYHGSVPNEDVRDALSKSDIFAYPSTWQETSCISMIEAMSSGTMCVHSNLGALYETAAGWTVMYQYQDQKRDHTAIFYNNLHAAIEITKSGRAADHLYNQSEYTNMLYAWEARVPQWDMFLRSLL